MKDTKHRVELYSIHDHTGLERHLARMAEKGWLLEKIGGLGWTYRRTEPKKLTFCVCYFPKASQFDPGPSEEQETFYDFCAHTGWTLAASSAQLQVFYNGRENPVPIDTDPATEVDAIHRTMTRGILPSQLVLLALCTLNAVLMAVQLASDPVRLLSSASHLFTAMCWALLALMLGVEWGGYFLWHARAVRAAEHGEFLETHSHRALQIGCLAVLTVGAARYFLDIFSSGNRMMMAVMALTICLYVPAAFLLVYGIKGLMKRKKAPTGVNRVVTCVGSFVLSLVIVGAIAFGVLYANSHGWLAGDNETYEYKGVTFTAYRDELPLTVEDLLDVHYGGYSLQRQAEQSFLLARSVMSQHPRLDAADFKEMPELDYTVVEVKLPILYGLCRDALLNQWDDERYWGYSYVPIDAAPWGAAEAYRQDEAEYGPRDQYLLCYPGRIVEIQFSGSWGELTPAQMAVVGEKLGGL